MIRKFLLVVLLGPVVELAVAVMVASRLGVLNTVLLVVATSVLGMFLIRSEGIAALRGMQRDLRRGVPPSLGLMNGILRVFGSVLLIVPGLVTSVLGLLLLIPPIRVLVSPLVVAWFAARASSSIRVVGLDGLVVDRGPGAGGPFRDVHRADTSGEIIDVDGWEDDEPPALGVGESDDGESGRLGSDR